MKHYVDFWRRYADFKGRTTVSGFWTPILLHVIVVFLFVVLIPVLLLAVFKMQMDDVLFAINTIYFFHGILYICPLTAISVRRLRDAGYSWRSLFWLLLPGIGMIALLARLCTKSTASRAES